jgi:hypothetical protein
MKMRRIGAAGAIAAALTLGASLTVAQADGGSLIWTVGCFGPMSEAVLTASSDTPSGDLAGIWVWDPELWVPGMATPGGWDQITNPVYVYTLPYEVRGGAAPDDLIAQLGTSFAGGPTGDGLPIYTAPGSAWPTCPVPTPTPTATPTPSPTATPTPTAIPRVPPTATPKPTAAPTGIPAATPQVGQSAPSGQPQASVGGQGQSAPTATPRATAATSPTDTPTAIPSPTGDDAAIAPATSKTGTPPPDGGIGWWVLTLLVVALVVAAGSATGAFLRRSGRWGTRGSGA